MRRYIFLFLAGIQSYGFCRDLWKSHVELSYVRTSGNSDIETFSTKAEIERNGVFNRLYGKGEFLYGKTDGKENTNKTYLQGRWERILSGKLFGFLQGDFLHDRFSGYDYRTVWGAGFGYDVLKNEKHYLKTLLSFGYTFEDFKTGGTNDYFTGNIGLTYTWNIRKNIVFKEDAQYLQSFKNYTVYYINSTTSVEVKINSHLSLGVGYKVSYQHSPPSPDYTKTDTTFLTSLILDY